MTTIRAADNAALDRISCAAHDWRFDLDVVRGQGAATEVLFPLHAEPPHRQAQRWLARGPERERSRLSSARARLVIARVEGVDIDDRAQVGWYDVGRIDFDEASKRVLVVSNIPMVVVIQVGELNASLHERA